MADKSDLYKIVVLGDEVSGKTALTSRFLETGLVVDDLDPMGVCKQVKIDGELCIIEVFELWGQEEYTALRDQFIRDGDGFVLVYSVKSRGSFTRITKFHQHTRMIKEEGTPLRSPSYQGSSPSAILNSLKSFGPSPIMLVGNMCDQATEPEVSSQEGLALANEFGCGFMEVSLANSVNVEKVFYDLVRQLRQQRHMVEEPAESKQTGEPKYPNFALYQSDDYVRSLKNSVASADNDRNSLYGMKPLERHGDSPDNQASVGDVLFSENDVIRPTEDKFDSGYGSVPDTFSKSNEGDDDNKSVRSILTNASRVFLPHEEKWHLVSAFAGDLYQDISLRRDLDDDAHNRISIHLPELLKTFTLKLEGGINSKAEIDAKEFVRQQRNLITRQFRGIKMPAEILEDLDRPSPPEDSMSLVEKMEMARWHTTATFDYLPQPEHVDQRPEEAQVHPRYKEVRSFLLDGSAYQWLLENAQSSALLTERKGTTLEAVKRQIDSTFSSMITPKSRQPQIFQAKFDIDWDLLSFLETQEYDTTLESAVERAITITGSKNNAQALSCMDYMCQTWPSSGREVVRVVQQALVSPNLYCSSCLVDGTELDINFRSSKTLIVARGGQAALTELCEQFSWLGAAMRTSPLSSGICLTTPSITTSTDDHSKSSIPSTTVHIRFTVATSLDNSLSTDVDGTCWHAMFRNPVVVNGFPILARHENERGLELPLDMMSILAEASFATRYDTTLVLKGLCTMLVPTHKTERSITWHFLFNESGKRIPYYSLRDRCPGWVDTDKVRAGLLEAGKFRNFVGWASNITRHIGTEEVEYGKIDWAGARKCSPGLVVEQKLTISVSKIVGVGGNVLRGNRDKPEYVQQSAYSTQIENARNINVLLYDVAARRGWLVDGASALLHLVRTQVVQGPYGGAGSLFNNLGFNLSKFNHPRIDGGPNAAADSLRNDRNMKHAILREFDSYTDETIAAPLPKVTLTSGEDLSNHSKNSSGSETPCAGEGRKEIYKTTCLRELVSQTWSTLEQIHDRQIEVATTHNTKQFQTQFGKKLEGYEFMGIVSGKHILTRRDVNLTSNGAAWIDLTRRINAITLFGQNFGDIYKPSEATERRLCKSWKTVPRGHDYLVAPVSLLKEIKQRSWEEGEVDLRSPEIAKGLFHFSSKDVFDTCGPSCKHDFDRVQQFHSSTRGKILGKPGLDENDVRKLDTFAEINGALLFGESSILDVEKLKLSSPLRVHMEGTLYDGEPVSSLQTSHQASYQANSATTSSDGTNSDSQPPESSMESTRTSLSPFDWSRGKVMGEHYAETGDATCGLKNPSLSMCASEACARSWRANDNGVDKSNTLSQQATYPEPAVTNMLTDDIPGLSRAREKGESIITGLRERFCGKTPSRWKGKSRAT